ncbi:MAG: nucleotidyltransferase family protein [Gammaproteobacteria bacterium]|nr:nucleotidyltransferase family protein [Gammaproteobacteria bacterium]
MSNRPAPALHVLILAAGGSTRFGSPKALTRIEGRALIQHIIARALAVGGQAVSVVLGAHAREIVPAIGSAPVSLIVNRDWDSGLASSIRAGVEGLPGGCAAVLIMLMDQPLVGTDALRRLVSTWSARPREIVAAQYAGGCHVPAIFPRWAFAELRQLRGDSGARALLHAHADRIVGVPLPEAALDIDTPEDLLGIGELP